MTSTEQTNGKPQPDVVKTLGVPAETSENRHREVAELNERVQVLRQLNKLETENRQLLEEVRDQDERDADHEVNRKIRAAQRAERLEQGLARAKQSTADDKLAAELEDAERRQRRSEAKAKAKRRKITDPNAALAKAYRSWRMYSLILGISTIAGIVWTSYAAAHGLGGQTPDPIFYIVEPLFCVPLVVIVLAQSLAAQHGRLDLVKPFKRVGSNDVPMPTTVGWIEIGLLLGSIGMATAGAVRMWDEIGGLAFLWCLAPLLVVTSAALQYVLAKLFGTLIAELPLDTQADESSARSSAVAGSKLADAIRVDLASGSIKQDELTIRQIQRRYQTGKLTAQVAFDLLSDQQEGR